MVVVRVVALALAMALAACASSGVKVDPAKVSSFEKGKTTYAEVVASLGTPTRDSVKTDGSRQIVYSHATASSRPQNFIPLVGPFVAKYDVEGTDVVFDFNPAGILTEITTTTSQVTTGAGS